MKKASENAAALLKFDRASGSLRKSCENEDQLKGQLIFRFKIQTHTVSRVSEAFRVLRVLKDAQLSDPLQELSRESPETAEERSTRLESKKLPVY